MPGCRGRACELGRREGVAQVTGAAIGSGHSAAARLATIGEVGMRNLFALAVLLFMATTVAAAPLPNTIGIYFDPAGINFSASAI